MMQPVRSVKRPASLVLLASILVVTAACSAKQNAVHIPFTATWEGEPVNCKQGPAALSDLRFFVTDLQLLDSTGNFHAVEFVEDDRWQQANVALIDLENGEERCANGTADTHEKIHGTADISDFSGIRFTLGVPFELNHANPLLAKAPLNDAAMHWHWRSGYKFLRAGVTTENDGTWLHLGSTACKGTVQDVRSCDAPNRVVVELTNFTAADRVEVNLSALFAGVDFNDGLRSDCSSGPAEAECMAMFAALGLTFGTEPSSVGSVFQVLR